MWKRAAVHAAAGNHQAGFFDLKHLSNLQPSYPGILQALQQAAQRCAEQRRLQTRVTAPERCYTRIRRGQPTGAGWGNASRQAQQGGVKQYDMCDVLGLRSSASTEEIKRAYRKLAAKYHPDKWMQASAEERGAAEERFKAVGAAYLALMAGVQHQSTS